MTSSLISYYSTSFFNYGLRFLFFGFIFCALARKKHFNIKKHFIYVILMVTLFGIFASLLSGNIRFFIKIIGIVFPLCYLAFCDKKHIETIVEIGTPFFIVLLSGAFIGFTYAMAGGQPVFQFPNPDGRMNYFFLTTSTNTWIGNIIRPGGIYDEPGSFSFLLCVLAIFRVLTGKSDILTYFMLLAGNITFSAAHAIFFVLYNFYMFGKYYKKKFFVSYIVSIVFAMVFLLYAYYDIFEDMLFYRLQGERLTNNNRTVQIDGSLYILKNARPLMDVVLFGYNKIEDEKYLFTNPLGPLIYDGIFVSWIYYMCITILLFGGVISPKYRFVLWGIAFIYMQRPFYSFGRFAALYIIAFFVYGEIKKVFQNYYSSLIRLNNLKRNMRKKNNFLHFTPDCVKAEREQNA